MKRKYQKATMKVVNMVEEQPLMAASSATTPAPQTFGGEFGYMPSHSDEQNWTA
jgi:hypothetical protein